MSAAGLPRAIPLVFASLAALAASCGGSPSTGAGGTNPTGAAGSGGQGGEGGQAGATTATPSTTTSSAASSTTSSKPPFQLQVSTSLAAPGALALTTNLPALFSDCQSAPFEGTPCADLDQDGLTDAWEDIVLDRLRPLLRFDEDESLFDDSAAVVHDVGRVALVSTAPLRARVFIMLGYSRDYGSCGFTSHNGDSERVALDLTAPEAVGPQPVGPGDVVTVAAYTAAHEGAVTDQGRLFKGEDLAQLVHEDDPSTGEPRWVVFPSQDKHATYATITICEDVSPFPCIDEDCAPDGVPDPGAFDLLPGIVNAGEDTAPLVTDLTAIGFPGEDAWADQKFCGGLGGGPCSSAVREKLLDDPF